MWEISRIYLVLSTDCVCIPFSLFSNSLLLAYTVFNVRTLFIKSFIFSLFWGFWVQCMAADCLLIKQKKVFSPMFVHTILYTQRRVRILQQQLYLKSCRIQGQHSSVCNIFKSTFHVTRTRFLDVLLFSTRWKVWKTIITTTSICHCQGLVHRFSLPCCQVA